MKKTFLLLTAFTFLFLNSCDKNDDEATDTSSSANFTSASLNVLSNTNWTFVNYSKEPMNSEFENRITLNFSAFNDDMVTLTGNNLVNNYRGSFKIDADHNLIIEKEEIASTLADGTDEEIEAEVQYLNNLADNATYFEVVDEQLLIYLGDKSNDDTVIMTFR